MLANGTKKAPPANVVLPHYIFGAISFLVLTVLMFFSAESFTGHYFSPKLLAITHIAVLGWISMVIFGALYQLLPVILLSELFSNTMARFTFGLFSAGVILLAFAFWNFSIGWPLQSASIFIVAGILLFSLNIYFTAKSAGDLTIEAEFILTSAIWLLVTVAIGVLMVFNLTHPFLPSEHLLYLKLHSHLGFAGWFILLVIGVSSKLIPMFLLSPETSRKKLKWSYYLINISLVAFLIDTAVFCTMERVLIYFLTGATGIICYLSFIYEVYKTRARKNADIGMKHSLMAFIFVLLPVLSGIILNSRLISNEVYALRLTLMYGSSIILGFLSLLVLGQTYKTLPFIVWLSKYSKLAGKIKTPLPKDLFSEKFAKLQFIAFVTGFPLLLAGIMMGEINIIKCACLLLIFTALMYNANVFMILNHKSHTVE